MVPIRGMSAEKNQYGCASGRQDNPTGDASLYMPRVEKIRMRRRGGRVDGRIFQIVKKQEEF